MIKLLDCFIASFFQCFAGNAFVLMLVGIAIGFCVGILPGLGGMTSLALMLPFVFKMTPTEAFAFLLGMLAVTSTTGDITSILIGVPGEPAAVATIVDGHPMAKKGEAGRALGAALMSSLVGAVFGAFALATAVPIIRPLVLTFGSPEFFMLALLGITFVASLSGEDLLKGVIAGGIGLFITTVGLSKMSAVPRYTFGQLFLWDGVGLVAVVIGFFAFPEIIDLAIQGKGIARSKVGKLGGVMEGVKDTFRHFWLVIRCSALATYLAIVPGMGAGVAQWVAYSEAIRCSPDKTQFGKGDVRGVLGPGAGNNSCLGGSLITTVAFGVPASITTAILMGAFIFKGITPGPDMLIPEANGGHLTLTYTFVWTIVISNIITVGFCLLFLNHLAKVTQVRYTLIIPPIIVLLYLGTFAEKNVFEDLFIMMIFGGLGWVMAKLNWPRPPLVLGLVLGSLSENRLFLTISNYGLAWLLRPGVLVIMGVILVGVLLPIFKERRQKRKKGKDKPPTPEDVSGNRTWQIEFSWERVFELGIIVIFICALWESRNFKLKTGLFPWTIGFSVLALTIAQLILSLMGKRRRSSDDHFVEVGAEVPTAVANRRTIGVLSWIIGYFAAVYLLGFPIGLTLCTFIQLKFGYRERWPITLIFTACVWAFIYGLFDRVMNVPFPSGQLFVWLGI